MRYTYFVWKKIFELKFILEYCEKAYYIAIIACQSCNVNHYQKNNTLIEK